MAKRDDRIDKRRVTMTSIALDPDGQTVTTQAVDYVRPDFLEDYVTDARARWQHVEVSDEPDAGPGGYAGDTYVPDFARSI
ncbi:MAG: hypothetical protein M3529_14410 [Actinomycetota bacterium]|nr:hypothetical protein [Actinomycetota bacterium]